MRFKAIKRAGKVHPAAFILLLSVCNDKEPSCYGWSLEGHCESNAAYMHKNCPLSCRVCDHNCTDMEADCTFWAKMGECENNTLFMLQKCTTACGLCTPRCEDTHGGFTAGPSANESMCSMWARQGDCEGNPDYVLKHCPVECGVCKPKCKDLHSECHVWANQGECRNNTNFMLKHCPNSCGVCVNGTKADAAAKTADAAKALHEATTGGCHDAAVSKDECAKWVAEGECTDNPAFMLTNCAASCGLCTNVCSDHDSNCATWATMNEGRECDENKAFMLKTCPASCGVCHELQLHLAEHKKNKDEV